MVCKIFIKKKAILYCSPVFNNKINCPLLFGCLVFYFIIFSDVTFLSESRGLKMREHSLNNVHVDDERLKEVQLSLGLWFNAK